MISCDACGVLRRGRKEHPWHAFPLPISPAGVPSTLSSPLPSPTHPFRMSPCQHTFVSRQTYSTFLAMRAQFRQGIETERGERARQERRPSLRGNEHLSRPSHVCKVQSLLRGHEAGRHRYVHRASTPRSASRMLGWHCITEYQGMQSRRAA